MPARLSGVHALDLFVLVENTVHHHLLASTDSVEPGLPVWEHRLLHLVDLQEGTLVIAVDRVRLLFGPVLILMFYRIGNILL